MAASKGHEEVCELLLLHGADLYAPDENGLTPFDLAASMGHKNTVKILAQSDDNDSSTADSRYWGFL